eukprot:895321-Heterocapsa_arctica.AAC.1
MSDSVATRYAGNCARGARMRVATACTPFMPAAWWMAVKAVDLSRNPGRVSGVAALRSSARMPLRMTSLSAASMASPPAFHRASMVA